MLDWRIDPCPTAPVPQDPDALSAPALGPFLLILFQLRLLMQNRIQQRIVNLDVSVVIDETKLAKLVHEMADAGSGGRYLRCFLTDIGLIGAAAFLPKFASSNRCARAASRLNE